MTNAFTRQEARTFEARNSGQRPGEAPDWVRYASPACRTPRFASNEITGPAMPLAHLSIRRWIAAESFGCLRASCF